MSDSMTIGELAKKVGVPHSTVRYYERRGLLRPAGRNASNYRIYGSDAVARLHFVRAAQSCGLSLEDIDTVLAFADGEVAACAEVQSVIESRLLHVKRQVRELREVKRTLERLRESCGESGEDGKCPAIEEFKGQPSPKTPNN
jgi:DNA-binding transcriptional MerR regulator